MKANFCTQTENWRFFENAPVLTSYKTISKFSFLFHKSVLWYLYLLLTEPLMPHLPFTPEDLLHKWNWCLFQAVGEHFIKKCTDNFVCYSLSRKLCLPFLILRTIENSLITALNFPTIIQALLHQSCLSVFSLVLIFLFYSVTAVIQ